MNAKITELAEQVWPGLLENWQDSQSGTVIGINEFAELIVRECVNRVRSRQQFATEDNQNVTQAFDLLIYDIESHFGVEE